MEPPDREYTIPVDGRARIHTMLGITQGDVDWFVVQLEYNRSPSPLTDDDWDQVARGDHHPEKEWGHDIREEGLHIDVYEHGEQAEREHYFAEFPINEAPEWCENHLEEYAEHYLAQYEAWHIAAEAQASE